MPKTSLRPNSTSDTKEARLVALENFTPGARVRHKITGKLGLFCEINLGYALPEVWVQFENDTEIIVPTSCNPLDLEPVESEITSPEKLPSVDTLMDKTEVEETQIAVVELAQELTDEEESDRHRLELKIERGIQQVERTFYEIGKALAELRDRKLYRSTHKNFGDYCKERFQQMSRRKAEYLIVACEVVDDLKSANNCSHFLPTSESQVRSMKDLTPPQRREVWQTGLAESGGKVPTAKTIKGIVETIKERSSTPPPIPYSEGDVVMIRGMGNPELRKFDGRWALALSINEYTITVSLDGKNVPVKPPFLEEIDPMYWTEIKAINERITRLQQNHDLDPMDDVALEFLRCRTCFTQRQLLVLERMEQDYAQV